MKCKVTLLSDLRFLTLNCVIYFIFYVIVSEYVSEVCKIMFITNVIFM